MKLPSARLSASLPLLLLLSSSASVAVFAQDSGVIPTNKVLVVAREYTKPGRHHSPHEKTEAGFVSASAASKVASHYYAVTSLSGPQRALFFYSYPSFAAWEAENKAIGADTTLTTALDAANTADGDLLSSTDASVWLLRDDMSLNPGFRVGARYQEISQFRVKPGHDKDWEDLLKLVIDGYKKGIPEAHWGAYQEAYGTPGDGFIFITTIKVGELTLTRWRIRLRESVSKRPWDRRRHGKKFDEALEPFASNPNRPNLFEDRPQDELPARTFSSKPRAGLLEAKTIV